MENAHLIACHECDLLVRIDDQADIVGFENELRAQ